jgi:hypothetical protein
MQNQNVAHLSGKSSDQDTFLEMPANIREHAIQFIKKWTDFDYYSH